MYHIHFYSGPGQLYEYTLNQVYTELSQKVRFSKEDFGIWHQDRKNVSLHAPGNKVCKFRSSKGPHPTLRINVSVCRERKEAKSTKRIKEQIQRENPVSLPSCSSPLRPSYIFRPVLISFHLVRVGVHHLKPVC